MNNLAFRIAARLAAGMLAVGAQKAEYYEQLNNIE